jgi:subtilisin-like proprotein convertase family protein
MKAASALACLLAGTLPCAAAIPFTYTSPPVNAQIPDASLSGFSTYADLTPPPGLRVNRAEVTLNLSGGFNGDLYAYLWHEDPSHLVGWSVLLNRSGRTDTDPFGYPDTGFSVTLTDSATTDIHSYGGAGGGPISGDFAPDARAANPLTATAGFPRTAFLNAFQGLAPEGLWVLFLADVSSGETTTLTDWGLRLELVPEPAAAPPAALALLALAAFRRRRSRTAPSDRSGQDRPTSATPAGI